MDKPTATKVDAMVDEIFRRRCSYIPIPMMEIPKLFRIARAAYVAGNDMEQAIVEFVASVHRKHKRTS